MNIFKLFESVGADIVSMNELSWPSDFFDTKIFDYHITVSVQKDSILRGRGTDFSREAAVGKAVSECIERIVCSRYTDGNTSGWAAHFSEDLARKNALLELIERDLYLCHFLTSTPFGPIEASRHRVPNILSSAMDKLEQKGYYCKIGLMGHPLMVWPVAVSFSIFGGQDFGVISGQSCADSFEEAAYKAVFEVIRNAAFQLLNREAPKSLSLAEFLKESAYSPASHYRWGLSSEAANVVRALYRQQSTWPNVNPGLSLFRDTSFKLVSQGIFENFFVVMAENFQLQTMFFGPSSRQKINIERLRSFAGNQDLDFEDLIALPHTHH